MKMVNKYYAVVSGREGPRIYTDWNTTQSMVNGFPGAIFKSFHNRADAESFINKAATATQTDAPAHTLPLIDRTIIYTDGSFNNKACGFGVVIITSNGDKITAHGNVPLEPTNNVAELYAIYVALSLVSGDAIIYSDSRYAISCFTAFIHTWKVNGWKGVANRQLIEQTFDLIGNRSIVFQYVPAHTGIVLNEEADSLANQGRMGTENLVIIKNGIRQSP